MSDAIDPRRLYPVVEAARLLPSPRLGKRTHPKTLVRWLCQGKVRGVSRLSGRRRYWFVWGSELLRLLGEDQQRAWRGRTRSQRERDVAAAQERLRKMGIDC